MGCGQLDTASILGLESEDAMATLRATSDTEKLCAMVQDTQFGG